MKNQYRIKHDGYLGFEVQTKKWWFPISWFTCWKYPYQTNTFRSYGEARVYARQRELKDEEFYK